MRSGLISGSFVPPQLLENFVLTRYRKKLIRNAAAEKIRMQKLLESSGIKLASVISDVFGVSGRALLLQLLTNGRLDEESIQSLVKGRIKDKVPQLLDALHCRLSNHQRFLLRQSWELLLSA